MGNLQFGDFDVDLQAGELRRNGRRLRLREKPRQLLAILLERPGRLVSKEELQRRLWPDVEVDAEGGLTEAVYKLRQLLDDSAQAPRYIETIPKRGYRFVAAVEVPQAAESALQPPSLRRRTAVQVAALVSAAVLGALTYALVVVRPPETPQRVLRRYVLRPEGGVAFPIITPDGRSITFHPYRSQFVPNSDPSWVWDLDRIESPRVLEGTEGSRPGAASWDGELYAFANKSELRVVPMTGGPSRRVCDIIGGVRGLVFSPDDELIVFADGKPAELFHVPTGGGTPQRLLADEEWQRLVEQAGEAVIPAVGSPYFLPLEDGRRVIIFLMGQSFQNLVFFAYDLDQRRSKVLGPGGYAVGYSSGHLVYSHSGQVWARPFSLEDLEFTDDPFLVVDGVGNFGSVSLDGTLIYPEAATQLRQLVWRSRGGEQLGTVGRPFVEAGWLSLSPDERRVSFSNWEGDRHGVIAYDLRTERATDVTGDLQGGFNAWSPEGEVLAFSSTSRGGYSVFQKRWDGAGEASALLGRLGNQKKMVTDWSPDRKYILYRSEERMGNQDIGYLERGIDGDWTAHPFVETEAHEREGSFSPDGLFVAFHSSLELGKWAVVVRPFPSADRQWVVSKGSAKIVGLGPRWSRDGAEIIYAAATGKDRLALVAVPVLSTEPEFIVGEPQTLLELPDEVDGWDVTKDGQRFIIAEPTGETPTPGIVVVQNWFQ